MTKTALRRRYAIVGTGHRAWMYIEAILGEHAEVAELVAWCEPNPGRIDYYDEQVAAVAGRPPHSPLPRYVPDQLEQMIAEQRVDVVVVTSPDHTHADLVARVLAAGADVVVEKPLTINAEGCRAITSAVAQTGRDIVMTFNYRYAPRNSALKEVISSGEIGTVT
ncbi:MAG TPA: Gfo/Idh/MocA family oxidoreductase, partial [Propionibacteriaceae bacterium]